MAQVRNTDKEQLNNADVRRPDISDLPYGQRFRSGPDLFDTGRAYEAPGESLLDEHEIEQELTPRRDGYIKESG